MPGILDKTLYSPEYGILTTKELRNSLLGRNLPPPVTNTLIEGGLQSYLPDPQNRTVINVPILGTQNENNPIHYDETEKLFPLGIHFRDTQNVNFNNFKPLNDDYLPFILTLPGDLGFLGYPLPAWGGALPTGPYPSSSVPDRFDLLNKGDKKGVQFPYTVLEKYGNLTFQKETPLGLQGGEHLQSAISEKVTQIEEENNPDTPSTGSITVDPNINIVDNFIDMMTGNQLYYNSLPNGAVGWQEFNSNNKGDLSKVSNDLGGYIEPSLSTEGRVNMLLERTSNTQLGFLFTLLGKNAYVPNYEDRRNVGTDLEGTNSRYYIGSERSTNMDSSISDGFQSSEFNDGVPSDPLSVNQSTTVDDSFFWRTGNQNVFNDKTLLYKTQKLLDDNPDGVWLNQTKKYFKDRTQNKLISRGNAMSKFSLIEAEANGNYCRVWTVVDEYNYSRAIRNTGLFSSPDVSKPGFSVTSENASLSVLSDNGFVKNFPTKDDSTTTFKKFMLSLENLAWSDNLADLPLSEIGPGDLLTSTKGRVMWFPPYDLSFDENVSANWTKTDFIGRGEPVFTYNNTTRSGQLKFKVLVDHPKVINGYRGYRTDAIEKFFAGCITPDTFLDYLSKNNDVSQNTKEEIAKKLNKKRPQTVANTEKKLTKMTVYFAKNSDSPFYAQGIPWTEPASLVLLPNVFPPDEEAAFKATLSDLISTNTKVKITVEGYSSSKETKPKKLSKDRADKVWGAVLNTILGEKENFKDYSKKIKGNGDNQATSDVADPTNRRVDVTIENDSLGASEAEHKEEDDIEFVSPQDIKMIDSLIIDENKYFDFVDGNYPNYFQTISEKIKYFHPGFHSTTPEGLNTRLTFLQQCMRQGNSIYDDKAQIQPQNLAFGKPPICILRIGDFFNTKIVINSLSISYAGGSAIQWDLNPSGIGVQPMMADVTMSIDIIGGQSLISPIDRLQNALSFNYYANTEMYDPRADSVDKSTGTITPGLKLGEYKKTFFKDSAIDAFYEDLKQEGITDELKDAKKTGQNTETGDLGGIKIDPSGSDIIVTSAELPAEVMINDKQDNNNLLVIEVKVEQKGIGFKSLNTIKTAKSTYTIPEVEYRSVVNYTVTSKGGTKSDENDFINSTNLKTLEGQLDVLEKTLTGLTSDFQVGDYSKGNDTVGGMLKEISEVEEKIKKKEDEIKGVKKGGNKVKVTSYYNKDKKGSIRNREFTLTANGLK